MLSPHNTKHELVKAKSAFLHTVLQHLEAGVNLVQHYSDWSSDTSCVV